MGTAELILKYIDTLVWPIVTVFILLYFRDELSRLIDRAKKVELPGGISIEAFEQKLKEAKQLEKVIESEGPSRAAAAAGKPHSATKNMINYGLKPSPNGPDLNYYRELATTDPQLALAGLQVDLAYMIRSLADQVGVQPSGGQPIDQVIRVLTEKGYISATQADFTKIIFQLSSYARYSDKIAEEYVPSIIELSETLIESNIVGANSNSN